ncbi:zinc carboxypeptidase [Streptomyces abikoensis]|nr:zinc carboxypeptidase [Streptomyces abikoensis]
MRRKTRPIVAVASLLLGGLAAAPSAYAQPAADTLTAWTARVTGAQVPLLLRAGVDGHELGRRVAGGEKAPVEVVLTAAQAGELRRQGVDITEKRVRGRQGLGATGDGVFRPYSGKNGLQQEITDTARTHPGLTKVVSIGKTVRGQDILALKVAKDATARHDGDRPAVLYLSNQHAREWITPEMTRRLMHHYLDRYGKDDRITKLVDSTELWFVLSANPDGYDYTFQSPATRLWRKNLRDNDGDGKITPADGVDLNRNFPYKWGYDNEGSSPRPASGTYRGPAAASEPETKALDSFEKEHRFTYAINYHSAAELLLYGVGWQVATPTPDDVLYRALAGTPEKSAIPGYRPQVSSELYTTNGEADGHAANVNGTMMFTPEMSTCETASAVDPNDRWDPADCRSSFNFPDDEKLIQQEFSKNIPFALSVAESAHHADRPSSSVGLDAPDLTPHAFTASHARDGEQTVAVTARKSLTGIRAHYSVDGEPETTVPVKAWDGGDRYGGEDNLRFDQYRATLQGAHAGSTVRVRFSGQTRDGHGTTSESFTFTVADTPRADTLVVTDEGPGGASRHAPDYVKALTDNGRKATVWDVATQGAPPALGVLSHYDTVLWNSGDARPDGATLLAVRDFVNEGGKLIAAGTKAGGESRVGDADTDDFAQYYLGAGARTSFDRATRFTGAGELTGTTAALGTGGSPLALAGAYRPISDELPPDTFPQFRTAAAGEYRSPVTQGDGSEVRVGGAAALTTRDTVLLGFGLEHVSDPRERAGLIGAALRAIGG